MPCQSLKWASAVKKWRKPLPNPANAIKIFRFFRAAHKPPVLFYMEYLRESWALDY